MKTGLESLDTGAPEITYSGNEGPKSPQQMQQMQMAQLEEEYDAYVFEMEEQGLEPMSMQQFLEQIAAEAQMSSQPQGIESMMQEPRTMAAFGGIMGADGRRGYIGGSYSGKDPNPGGDQGAGQYQGGSGAPGSAESKGSSPQDSGSTGNDDGPRGPQELGTSTRTVNRITAPPPQEFIGRTKYPVTSDPDNIEERRLANKANAAARAAKFQAIQDAEAAEAAEKLRLIQLSQRGGQPIDFIPAIIKDQENIDDDEDDDPVEFVNRFAAGATPFSDYQGGVEVDPMQFLASGGIAGLRQPAAFGGIMGDDGRRAYGLGSIFKKITKPFKKVTKGIKKIAKSPLGKAALMYLAGTYLGGLKAFGGSGLGEGQKFGFKEFGTRLMSPFTSGEEGGIANLANMFKSGEGTGTFKFPGFGKEKVSYIDKIKAAVSDGTLSAEVGKKAIEEETLAQILGKTTASTAGKVTGKDLAMILGPAVLGGIYTAKQPQESLDQKMANASTGPGIKDVFGMDLTGISTGARAGTLDPNKFNFLGNPDTRILSADGGRIGLKEGLTPRQAALSAMYGEDDDENNMYKFANGGSAGLPPVSIAPEGFNSQSFPDDESTGITQATPQNPMPMPMRQPMMNPMMNRGMMSMQQPRIMAQEGGLMNLGGMEKDYRAEGGFVPIGGEERADDVPARLSKNEFVFTADAVRNAGGGDIDKGAEVMENMMENLEAGGKVSQQSQGLEGAREMFATQQRLGEVL